VGPDRRASFPPLTVFSFAQSPTNQPPDYTNPVLFFPFFSPPTSSHFLFSYIISSQWPLASGPASSHRWSRSTRSSNLVSHPITEQPGCLLCSDLTWGHLSRSQKEEERRTGQQAARQEPTVERAGSKQSAERETWQQSAERKTRQSSQPHWRCKGMNLSKKKGAHDLTSNPLAPSSAPYQPTSAQPRTNPPLPRHPHNHESSLPTRVARRQIGSSTRWGHQIHKPRCEGVVAGCRSRARRAPSRSWGATLRQAPPLPISRLLSSPRRVPCRAVGWCRITRPSKLSWCLLRSGRRRMWLPISITRG
jgi:hypothetical protein